jgi:putative ABC transport system permease protein
MPRPTRKEAGAVHLYRGLLLAYPAAFRDEYGRELCLVFADRCREAGSVADKLLIFAEAACGILREAPREHLHMILQDLRHAIRILRKDRASTAVILLIMALGIGSSTVVFSLANGLLLRPLPYPRQDRIVAVDEHSPKDPNEKGDMSFLDYLDYRAQTQLLDDVGLYQSGEITILRPAGAERIQATVATDGVFRVLGVPPLLGRVFTRDDCHPNAAPIALIGETLWRRDYGADPNIAGKMLERAGRRYTIVGVMPARFRFPENADVWLPLKQDPAKSVRTDYNASAVALLKPGVSIARAAAEWKSILDRIHQENRAANNGWLPGIAPVRNVMAETYRKGVITLLIAVGFLLLIACANVSNLLLVKASARMREMAVRAAIGASRSRLIRQLITESLILGVACGAIGILLAYAGTPALLSLIPVDLPRWMDFSIDYRVLVFAVGMSVLTSIAFGVAPAIGGSWADLTEALKEGGRGGTTGVRQVYLRHAMIVAEVALSVILLVGAGLMIRSFAALRSQSLGYRPDKVLSLNFDYPQKRYADGPPARALLDHLEREISSIPGVEAVAFASAVPLTTSWTRIFTIEGRPLPLKDLPFVNHLVVTPGYLRTLGLPLLQGRDFADTDFDSSNVLIISQAFAHQYWPNENAIGKRIRFGPPANNEPWHTVIGVVADTRQARLKGADSASVYLPFSADWTPDNVLVRSAGDPRQLTQAMRARMTSVDRDMSLSRIFTLREVIERRSWQDHFLAVLFGAFAALALMLAAVGLFAVLSYTVSMQSHEIGIRLALGASGSDVRLMVLRHGLGLAGIGLLVGGAGAAVLTRLLKSQLFAISPLDPAAYVTAISILLGVATLATWIPAHRATRIDPMNALRT